ncbi:methylated-DNA--[protein]-cysteine S-methyltransferase [Rhodanobacter sp. AS-Z3]|uniref:methylated-DNA--[protein]-cysteine S-methyltransferase n=1 Tax=Rhodanobacter sp. AS-Z3 TaxID=3031330 RepID=UPI00247AFC59|nr:methylated-DNA--[protein]-cysteine S-methyltransferase [Rhodanobacter sp. AS-Z3]WEN14048.1 methylated-DNA--[protein]-cysteine S-methyltransferase [Rhodanobacter sp. AS-Z3]
MNHPAGTIHYFDMASPVGLLRLIADDEGLREIWFEREDRPEAVQPTWVQANGSQLPAPIAATRKQLQEYFAGKRQHFELPLHPVGTPFQLSVWQQLRLIPYGTTISYGELARRVGNPNASRAVGAANGRNPLSIVVPCHRVIGSNGSLTGFSGGLPIKQKLLALEQRTTGGDLFG